MEPQRKRHAFGQHFLRDQKIISTIIDRTLALAREKKIASLLEIGPGKGALTLPLQTELLAHPEGFEFFIAEIDRDLIAHWKVTSPSFRILEGDFVQSEPSQWGHQLPLGVMSNLPYSSGTAIVTKLCEHPEKIPFMVLMFQAEVARRLRAESKSKDWGSLSLWIQNRWDVSLLCKAPPGAFSPPPKVDSEVVVLLPRTQPRVSGTDSARGLALFQDVLKLAFTHRRKMLRSGMPKEGPWLKSLEEASISGEKRAEALTWEEWGRWVIALLKNS